MIDRSCAGELTKYAPSGWLCNIRIDQSFDANLPAGEERCLGGGGQAVAIGLAHERFGLSKQASVWIE